MIFYSCSEVYGEYLGKTAAGDGKIDGKIGGKVI
jgi:hypothetical protein